MIMKLRLKNNDILENSRDVKTYLFRVEMSKIERRLRMLTADVDVIMREDYSCYDPAKIFVPYCDLRVVDQFRLRLERFSDFLQPYVEAYHCKEDL